MEKTPLSGGGRTSGGGREVSPLLQNPNGIPSNHHHHQYPSSSSSSSGVPYQNNNGTTPTSYHDAEYGDGGNNTRYSASSFQPPPPTSPNKSWMNCLDGWFESIYFHFRSQPIYLQWIEAFIAIVILLTFVRNFDPSSSSRHHPSDYPQYPSFDDDIPTHHHNPSYDPSSDGDGGSFVDDDSNMPDPDSDDFPTIPNDVPPDYFPKDHPDRNKPPPPPPAHEEDYNADEKHRWDAMGSSALIFDKPPIGAEDGIAQDWDFGTSISLSADGKTLAIGSPDFQVAGTWGFVRVYEYDLRDNEWIRVGDDISMGHPYDKFGSTVALSADGTVLVVSAPEYKDLGLIQAFKRPTEQDKDFWESVKKEHEDEKDVEKIVGNTPWFPRGASLWGDHDRDFFGSSLALSSSARSLAATRWGEPDSVAVYDYTPTDIWNKTGHSLKVHAEHNWHGASVAIADHYEKITIVAVGAPYANNSRGEVTVYHRATRQVANSTKETIIWRPMGQTLTGEDEDHFGDRVDLSEDGHTMVVSTDGGHYAVVYSYEQSTNKWVVHDHEFKMIHGRAVLAPNGRVLAVMLDPQIVHVHHREEGSFRWTPYGQPLVVDYFITDITLSFDGDVIAIAEADGDRVSVFSIQDNEK